MGVEEDGEAAVVGGNEVRVGGEVGELEDGVPVAAATVDPLIAGDERVSDGQDLLGGLEQRLGVARTDREGLAPDEELLSDEELPLRCRYYREIPFGPFSLPLSGYSFSL